MPRTITVHSANNVFQHAQVLSRNRQKRQRYGEVFVEGVRSINAVMEHGWRVNALYYSPERGLSDWARGVLARSAAALHVELPSHLMQQLSDKADTSELIALVAMPEDRLSRIPLTPDPLLALFDRPASPGNLGAVIRSCDALGVHGLVLSGHGADLYDPETIRASTGSLFALPCVRVPGPREVAAWLEEVRSAARSVQVVGTDERGSRMLWEHDLTGPTVLMLGNETWGLSAAYREMCDVTVRIPIGGFASSLNVACAASIALYEVRRQRGVDGPYTAIHTYGPL